MKGAKVLSKKFHFKLEKSVSGRVIAKKLQELLRNLGDQLNYNGKIIGHIKSIAISGENYVHLSLTSLANIDIKAAPDWYNHDYTDVEVTVNIIIFGFSKEHLEQCLDANAKEILFKSLV